MARLYADENFLQPAVEELRRTQEPSQTHSTPRTSSGKNKDKLREAARGRKEGARNKGK